MKIRSIEFARGLAGHYAAPSALFLTLLLTGSPAEAQLDGGDPIANPEPAPEEAPASEPAAADAGSGNGEGSTPEGTPVASSADSEEVSLGASTQDLSAPATTPDASAPPAAGPRQLLVAEILPMSGPESGYPNDPIAGIPGGSLMFSINRMQWPYQPAHEGKEGLRVAFSGFNWVDGNFRQVRAGLHPLEPDLTEYRVQGRLKLRVNPVYNFKNDYFVQSSVEFVANVEQNNSTTNYVDIDEAWLRFGKWKAFDFTIGRTQGFEIYHFGMGLDLNTYEREGAYTSSQTPVQPYGLTDLWDRGVNNGAAAIHWYLPKWLRLEALARVGIAGDGGLNIGFRPAGVLDFGVVKLKAGYERQLGSSTKDNTQARTEMQGFASSLQFVFNPWIEFGGGVGHRLIDKFDADGGVDAAGSSTTTTAGGFLNVRPYFDDWMVGVGFHHTEMHNFNFDNNANPERFGHQQMFAALQYVAWKRLYIKYVLSYANARFQPRDDNALDPDGFANESLSHRLRFMMMF